MLCLRNHTFRACLMKSKLTIIFDVHYAVNVEGYCLASDGRHCVTTGHKGEFVSIRCQNWGNNIDKDPPEAVRVSPTIVIRTKRSASARVFPSVKAYRATRMKAGVEHSLQVGGKAISPSINLIKCIHLVIPWICDPEINVQFTPCSDLEGDCHFLRMPIAQNQLIRSYCRQLP